MSKYDTKTNPCLSKGLFCHIYTVTNTKHTSDHLYHQTVKMLNRFYYAVLISVDFSFKVTLSDHYGAVVLVLFISRLAPCSFVHAAQVLL